MIKGNWNAKYLQFTKEERDQKKAARAAHSKAISVAMQEAHAANAKKGKATRQTTLDMTWARK